MGEATSISWCDHTFNGWIGCTRVSPACTGCYAAHMMDTRYGRVQWGGPGKGNGTRVRTSAGNWHQPIKWNRRAEAEGTRPFVFCSSLADVFDNQIEPEWRADLFDLIRKTPRLVWLLLTKRPQNIVKMSTTDNPRWLGEPWPSNAAIGTTVEDQTRADLNIPHLLHATDRLKPAFNFLSCEPLLGPLMPWTPTILTRTMDMIGHSDVPGIDWVITGGETDQGEHKARPTHPLWVRSLRNQCATAGVAYHHKQNGEWASAKGLPGHLPIGHVFDDGYQMIRLGKARSGRLLDGIEHNARPQVAA